jgi:hypothetical protein
MTDVLDLLRDFLEGRCSDDRCPAVVTISAEDAPR